jgi:predicted nicotinamide N-methyase
MSKDTNQNNAFGLTILKNSHKDVRRIKRQNSITSLHGNKFWKSTLVLIDYLQECLPDQLEKKLKNEPLRVLEIGCGWGLAGIFCAKKFNAQVTSLDADSAVFPFLLHHAQLNGVEITTFEKYFENITTQELSQYDLIIGADICFWDELVPIIADLFERALLAGVSKIVVTDPGRPTFREVGEYFYENYNATYSDWDVPSPHNVWGLILDIENQQS